MQLIFFSIFEAYRKAYADVPRPIWLLSSALFVNRLGTMVLPFLTLYFKKNLGYSDSTAGFMISLYGFGSVLGAYVGGKLTGKVGAIRLQVILLSLSVPVFLCIPFCTSPVSLAVSILLLSVFSEGVRPANQTAITEFSNTEQRTRAFALNRMALNLGVSFGPVIGGLLISISFFWIFVVDALTTGACAALLCYFFAGQNSNQESLVDTKQTLLLKASPAEDWYFILYLGLTFSCALVFFQFFTTYPLYLNEHYLLNEFQIGLIFAINTVMIVFFEMLLVERAKHWNLITTIAWGCFLTCIGFGILPFGSAIGLCVLSMVILTIGEMLASPMSSSWVSQRSEHKDTGSYMGWYTMSYSLAFIVGPAIGGVMYQWNKESVFYASILVGGLILGGFFALDLKLKQESE